jgi:hypothetical protein
VKKSLEQGKVLDCVKPGEKEETKKEGEDEKKEEIVWKGFKPVNDGAYTVYYDESWGEWFSDVGKGALVAGLVVGAVSVPLSTNSSLHNSKFFINFIILNIFIKVYIKKVFLFFSIFRYLYIVERY